MANNSEEEPSVRKSIRVKAPIERAFSASSWNRWRHGGRQRITSAKTPFQTIFVEPRVGRPLVRARRQKATSAIGARSSSGIRRIAVSLLVARRPRPRLSRIGSAIPIWRKPVKSRSDLHAEGPGTTLVELEHQQAGTPWRRATSSCARSSTAGAWSGILALTPEKTADTRRRPVMRKPVLFLRIAAVLTLIHAVLHTIGGVFGKPEPGPATIAFQAMTINQFLLLGHTRSYADFYRGLGLGSRYSLPPRRLSSGN